MHTRVQWFWFVVAVGCHRTPSPRAVVPGARLGAVDFQSWCDATGGGRAVARVDWSCERSSTRVTVDPNAVCRRQYPAANAHAETTRVGDTFTWACYAGVRGELGGLNPDAYCRSTGALRAMVDPHRRWYCVQPGNLLAAVDLDAACRFAFPQSDGAHARQLREGNPTSWVCVRR